MNAGPASLPAPSTASSVVPSRWDRGTGFFHTPSSVTLAGTSRWVLIRYSPTGTETMPPLAATTAMAALKLAVSSVVPSPLAPKARTSTVEGGTEGAVVGAVAGGTVGAGAVAAGAVGGAVFVGAGAACGVADGPAGGFAASCAGAACCARLVESHSESTHVAPSATRQRVLLPYIGVPVAERRTPGVIACRRRVVNAR